MALEKTAHTARRLELPTIIFGPVEVHRLQREMESLQEFLQAAAIREPGKQAPLPRTSRMLEELAADNKLNLLHAADQKKLITFLQNVENKAPVIHISFAADPSAGFTAKIVAWLRSKVHPYALLQLGLQPTIAAGCIVRTANKTFDFSLRNRFDAQRALLIESLERGSANATVADANPPPAPSEVPA
jgi:F0F1-type ATP synthase delta subunit